MSKFRSSNEIRRLVTDRARGCCEYCFSQEQFASGRFSMDHIIPEVKGGLFEIDNLALACQSCNNFKYSHIEGYDHETQAFVALYHPRKHVWAEHFYWNENFTVLIGLTPTGRATIQRLQLNRDFLINQRVLYCKLKVHPPMFDSTSSEL